MMRAVHVRLADGTIETGFDAWRRILAELDGWRWVAWAAGLTVVKHLGGIVYSMVARNRHRFGVART